MATITYLKKRYATQTNPVPAPSGKLPTMPVAKPQHAIDCGPHLD